LYVNSLPRLLLATSWNSSSESSVQEQGQVFGKSVASATSSEGGRGSEGEEGEGNEGLGSVCVSDTSVGLVRPLPSVGEVGVAVGVVSVFLLT
jgi:hypothetical protein